MHYARWLSRESRPDPVAAQSVAVVIAGSEPTEEERSLEKIVEFFKIPCKTLPAQAFAAGGAGPSATRVAVLTSSAGLAAMLQPNSSDELPPALRQAESIFAFDFDESPLSTRVLRALTGASEARVAASSRPDRKVAVTKEMPDVSGALSGITAECSTAHGNREFRGADRSIGFRAVLSTDSGTKCFECRSGGVTLFLSVYPLALDIDRPVDGRYFDVRRHFSSVLPLLFFLKRAFPDAVGSNRAVGAALIVDDPALKRRYGFMQFDRVLSAMMEHAFCTTVAFIPWNWRRTNERTADIFLSNRDRYALVLHGCDHTSSEFGTSSLPVLNHKAKAALNRANRHRERTGVHISPIMVFPQGVFSPEALYVLKCNNFTAAVNTEVNPVGAAAPQTRVRELWDVAVMQYSSFPVFTRRYMSHGLENFAFDMFLGKPCLLVGHHEVFKNGGRELMTFIDRLNSLEGGVRWGALDTVIARSYSSRRGADGIQSVRMFANEMVLESGEAPARFRVEKQELDQAAISRVTCGDRDVAWTWNSGCARFEVDVSPGKAARIRVEHVDPLGVSVSGENAKYRMAVRARRYLSEVRDDYICRSDFLNACTGKMRSLFR
jgi:hypothetical protein